MQLQRPLVFLDTETTGVDPEEDRIICLAVERWWPTFGDEASRTSCMWEVHPMRDIPKEASAVHGYTNESVASFPRFSSVAADIIPWLTGCDVSGFNLSKFDLAIIRKEFLWANITYPITDAKVVDVLTMYYKLSPRNLSAAVLEYCGRDHEGAHGAAADTRATSDVLIGMMKRHPEIAAMNLDQLATYCQEVKVDGGQVAMTVDMAGKLIKMANGDICYSFGMHKGVSVKAQPGYAQWMLKNNFPEETKQILRELLTVPPPLIRPTPAPPPRRY